LLVRVTSSWAVVVAARYQRDVQSVTLQVDYRDTLSDADFMKAAEDGTLTELLADRDAETPSNVLDGDDFVPVDPLPVTPAVTPAPTPKPPKGTCYT
jgi:hypothetical protein